MLITVAKDTRINIRLTPEFRGELEELAAYHGLTLSSFVHSALVKAVRNEKQALGMPSKGLRSGGTVRLQQPIAHIGPGQRQVNCPHRTRPEAGNRG